MKTPSATKNNTRNGSPQVAGFIRNSFVDYPAEIAFVIFLGGCNFSCPHCHNRHICHDVANKIPFDEVIAELRAQIGFVDGVVISGGEPTRNPYLREIIDAIRGLNTTQTNANTHPPLKIKLDTNGSNFGVLRNLVDGGLVDYVAMDIKAPIEKYQSLGFVRGAGAGEIIENVKKSIAFLQTQTRVPVMFRTTPVPELTAQDLSAVKALALGAGKGVINPRIVYRVNDYVDI